MATLTTETFTGSDGSSWPSGWTPLTGFGGSVTQQGGRGRLSARDNSNGYAAVVLNSMPATAGGGVTGKLYLSDQNQYANATLFMGFNSDGNVYGAGSVNPRPNLAAVLELAIASGTAGQSEASYLNGATRQQTGYSNVGVNLSTLGFRFEIQGTAWRWRYWTIGSAEPTTWQKSGTLNTVPPAGRFIILNRAASSLGVIADFDDLEVYDYASGATQYTIALASTATGTSAASVSVTDSVTVSAASSATGTTAAEISPSVDVQLVTSATGTSAVEISATEDATVGVSSSASGSTVAALLVDVLLPLVSAADSTSTVGLSVDIALTLLSAAEGTTYAALSSTEDDIRTVAVHSSGTGSSALVTAYSFTLAALSLGTGTSAAELHTASRLRPRRLTVHAPTSRVSIPFERGLR